MESKNLLLKFGVLLLAVLVCVYALYTNGLRLGIDLRGGSSMIFEIQTNEAEIESLRLSAEKLKAQRQQADEQRAKEIDEALERNADKIEALKSAEGSPTDLINRVIKTIKGRLDPKGLMSLEIRPRGKDRFEIRIPPVSQEAKDVGNTYRQALADLADGNISWSVIRRILSADEPARAELIDRHSGGDETIARLLTELVDQHATLTAAQTAFDAAGGGARQKAQDDLDNATADYQRLIKQTLATNINVVRLSSILKNYVSDREALLLKKKPEGEKEILTREERLDKGLAELKAQHPTRQKEIDAVVDIYKTWSDLRYGLTDSATVKRMIRKVGVLEFRIAPFAPTPQAPEGTNILSDAEQRRYTSLLKELGPDEVNRRMMPYVWLPVRDEDDVRGDVVLDRYPTGEDGQLYVLLHNTPGNTMLHEPGKGGWQLTDARQGYDRNNLPAVAFELNAPGASRMASLTSAHQTHNMAIVLDDVVYSAPRILEDTVISSRGLITVGGDPREVADLIKTLNAGSLPARINPEPVSESSFGPALGRVSIERGIRAAAWSLAAVAIFMLIYYRGPGGIANIALLLNIVLILGTMALLKAVFTLPGIAGIILTIGIAVDANVLIFERLREEQLKGQSPALTLANAYRRAFSAIFDANLTTLIVCLILLWIGTEEIKGFAITLGLGVVFSLFTAMVVTKWVFQVLLKRGAIRGPLRMTNLQAALLLGDLGGPDRDGAFLPGQAGRKRPGHPVLLRHASGGPPAARRHAPRPRRPAPLA
ncbi:MAG: protein translocase subunit SecD [Planctomycetota bacterium]|jgi:protein-export membrane protein SecD